MEDMLGKEVKVGDLITYGGKSGGYGYASVGIVKAIDTKVEKFYSTEKTVEMARVRGISTYKQLKCQDGFIGKDNIFVINDACVPAPYRVILKQNLQEYLDKQEKDL